VITFSIRGDQLIVDPAVGTNSSQGTATVQWGRQLWAKDHRIEITAINDTRTELTGKSGITGLKVFDASGKQVAEYRPMNPGQTADIQSDLSDFGDDYARINTSVMQPVPGSPWIGPIMITNGDNSFATLPQTFPVGNGAYDIAPALSRPLVAPCFGPDVHVDVCRAGMIPVRDVRVGDVILTADGRQPVLWTDRRHCSGNASQDWPVDLNGDSSPLCTGSSGTGGGRRQSILRRPGVPRCGPIYYHHILLPVHSVILTARNRVESLLMTPYSLGLWNYAPALCMNDGASTRLTHDEWRRGELLRQEQHAGAAVTAIHSYDKHMGRV
jgi:hypothetical protein